MLALLSCMQPRLAAPVTSAQVDTAAQTAGLPTLAFAAGYFLDHALTQKNIHTPSMPLLAAATREIGRKMSHLTSAARLLGYTVHGQPHAT